VNPQESREILTIYSCLEVLQRTAVKCQKGELNTFSTNFLVQIRDCLLNLLKFVLKWKEETK
jgi:hypothetical protein